MPIKFSLLVLFFLLSWGLHAQVTSILDPNFEQKLVQLGIDSDAQINGQILDSDAQSVNYLDISKQSGDPAISSLIGLAAFSNLDTLICAGHKIAAINTSLLSQLAYLDCSNNQVQNLNLFNNICSLTIFARLEQLEIDIGYNWLKINKIKCVIVCKKYILAKIVKEP